MPKRTIGPFNGLQNLPDLDVNTADSDDILERMYVINECLAAEGCNCNGHHAGHQRDEYWGSDLSELVCRCTPHEIQINGADGVTTATVSVKLSTLRAEVDGNNEICAWIYEES